MTTFLMSNYMRLPLRFTHGEGAYLFDSAGNRYLDAIAGIAVNTLGHAHPKLVAAIADQAQKLIHCSNLYEVELQEQLAAKLCQLLQMDQAFFCNSGLEANEASLKLARLWGKQKGIEHPHIVVFENAFHGRSLATLAASGNAKIQQGFEPLFPGFIRIPINDVEALHTVAKTHKNISAVWIEPIQGEGGIRVADAEYLQTLRKVCDAQDWVLMVDEVQCGIGRTGRWLALEHAQIQADVVSLAKGLAGGVPIGAVLARQRVAQLFSAGKHGSTFGGNPLAARAALTTLEVIESEQLMQNAVIQGEAIRTHLQQAFPDLSITGKGLMIGINLKQPCGALVSQALAKYLLINVTQNEVVRLLPSLNFSQTQALCSVLTPLLQTFLAK